MDSNRRPRRRVGLRKKSPLGKTEQIAIRTAGEAKIEGSDQLIAFSANRISIGDTDSLGSLVLIPR